MDQQDGNESTARQRSAVAEVPRPVRSAADAVDDATVLVVDDQPANVALLMRLVREAGIADVHGETDARRAVARCLDVDADLVLLDLHMPHRDGFAIMAELRDALPDDAFVPVLVLTADTTTRARDRALSAGAKDFLTKPFDRAEVVLRVRNLLETRVLYADLQRGHAVLQADLSRRLEEERCAAEERRRRIERIDRALSGERFGMVFQPIVDLTSCEVVGVEALARFRGEPLRPPDQWFTEAASVGRGTELELAAVGAALAQLDQLPPDTFLSANVSPSTATLPELARLLETAPGRRIVIELTEHTHIPDYEPVLRALDDLRRHGVRIAVDDAGSGYSSLRHVLRLRPDIVKLDIALIRGIHENAARRALASAMVTFAREIDAVIVAEGVETHEELAALRSLAVTWGQGYHLATPGALPLPASRLDALRTPSSTAMAHAVRPVG
jgi:EAL domain-containing protein (putative c-di-GMP-specific phosphodiesterase class I)/CheY-like chemotaxis protein